MNPNHWAEFYLKQPVLSYQPLGEFTQHQTDLLYLADGTAVVCKLFSSTWLGESTAENLEFTESLAKKAELTLKLAVSAQNWPSTSQKVLIINEQCALLIPYCRGSIKQFISEKEAFLLGQKLAELHQLNFSPKGAKPFPDLNISQINEIQTLIEHCSRFKNYKSEEWVVSHRDMHLDNIVWREDGSPQVIDWESAGLIHPFVELLGLANNCAGIVRGGFDENLFSATLMGYQSIKGELPQTDPILWRLSLQTWLFWYEYCLKCPIPTCRVDERAELVLKRIKLIMNSLGKMQKIYEH